MELHSFPTGNHQNTRSLEEDHCTKDNNEVGADMFRRNQRSPHGSDNAPQNRRRWSILFCPISPNRRRSTSQGVVSFRALAQAGSFNEITSKLKSSTSDGSLKQWLYASSGVLVGESPLHILLQFQPPLNAVITLIQTMHELNPMSVPEATSDAMGRTPLHVACAFCCNIVVVARLLNGASVQFRTPASVQDAAFMIPLHWACQAACAVSAKKDVDNMAQVIGFLVETFPSGVDCTNAAGATPAQILQSLKLTPSVRDTMQNALRRTLAHVENSSNNSDDSLSLLPSWIPNEISVQDGIDELEVSLLGLKGATPPKRQSSREPIKEKAECSLTGTGTTTGRSAESTEDSMSPLLKSNKPPMVISTAPTPEGVSVDFFAPMPFKFEDENGIPMGYEEANDYMDNDTWCPFETSSARSDAYSTIARPPSLSGNSSQQRSVMPLDLFVPDLYAGPSVVKTDFNKRNMDNSVSVISTTHVSSSSNMDIYDVIESMELSNPTPNELWA